MGENILVSGAINKVKKEMEKEKNPYVQAIGDFLLNAIKNDGEAADKVMQQDKTIMNSLKEMEKEASKVKVGNCAVLTDQQGFEIVAKYYGFEYTSSGQAVAEEKKEKAEHESNNEEKQTKEKKFLDISLEDLLS